MSHFLPLIQSETDSQPLNGCMLCGCKEVTEYLRAPDRFHLRRRVYQLLRCPCCSLVWLDNSPTPGEMSDHYGPEYEKFIRSATEQNPEKAWRGPRENVLHYKHGGNLLDLGCGAGAFLGTMRIPGWNLYGIEISEHASRIAQISTGATVFCGDILTAEFPENSFEVITCFHVFEHLYHPRQVMQQVLKWLKPGGMFFLYVPNIDSAEARLFRSYWYPLELPRHLYHFSPTSLSNLAKAVGLQEVSLSTQRVSFFEYSTRYILDDIFRAFSINRLPLAQAKDPGLLRKVWRKLVRFAALPFIAGAMSLAGDGEIVEAMFKKRNAHCYQRSCDWPVEP